MAISCGSQIILCDVPIRLDTYNGCSHGCKYCFVQRRKNISVVSPENCINVLKSFINMKRGIETKWCDWKIPLHWGGVSDPFQPLEKKYKVSYNVLRVFLDTQYPFIFSTKGALSATREYLDIIKDCLCVAQISMVCDKYDILEPGAPNYNERLKMAEAFASVGKRVIARIQPFMPEVLNDVLNNIPKLKNVGVYGVVVEGMIFVAKKPGLVKVRGDWCYPEDVLYRCLKKIKEVCHLNHLSFYSGENRLRTMGDNLCCCGIDGLNGFVGNNFNIMHLKRGEPVIPTQKMREIGTAQCFRGIQQESTYGEFCKKNSFFTVMMHEYQKQENAAKRG